ncbi:MAG: hypothetical protein M3120_00295 [Pseudomonadota bacterium]|nr:hypothetical protein [Pseudomonadota bacterium]
MGNDGVSQGPGSALDIKPVHPRRHFQPFQKLSSDEPVRDPKLTVDRGVLSLLDLL